VRFASALNRAAVAAGNFVHSFLLDLAFDSGTVRVCDGGINIVVGANTYTGLGDFGTFDGVTEDIDQVAYGVRFELAGIDSGVIATLRTERYQGRAARLYCAFLDSNLALIDTPEDVWSGYMDYMDIEPGQDASKIVLNCEHRIRNAPPVSRFSNAEQQVLHSGDRFFEYLHLVSGYTSNWGGKSTSWKTGPGGGYTL
jgi:hypothetical protein